MGANGKPMSFAQAVAGGKSVGVPGNFRLMAQVHRRYGKLAWARLFDPAIRLARDGYAVTPRLHSALTSKRAMLAASAEAREIYYQPDGAPKPVGSTIRNPRLAALLEAVARRGAEHFYTGRPADRLVETVRTAPANPSTMSKADVAAYRAQEREPVCGRYRVYRICGMAPPSSGGIAVYAILKQLERFDLAALGADNVTAWHLIGESMRLAYADREQWIGDPDHVRVPTPGLISDDYLAARSALISPDRAMPKASFGTPAGAPRVASVPDTEMAGTSHFSVADRFGDVASMTSTIEAGFGSGLVVDGYVLNNELTDFNFVPAVDGVPSANRVEAGKRPRSSMSPTIVYGPDGKVVAAVGAAGGPTIIAQVAKALIGVLDWKMPMQDAIALPLVIGAGDQLRLEQGTRLETMAPQLRALGHKVVVTGMGLKANGIEMTADGWRGGADPRSEGVVVGTR
jgi:gamma-glutamyltranspeptidase/glutathione hydrolase